MTRRICATNAMFAIAAIALTGVLLACSTEPPPLRWPNVLLVTLDTTRADHLGCYGYGRDTSPELDAFAKGAVVFDLAYSTSSWTLPAHASLFTGRFPTSHGARFDADGPLLLSQAIPDDPVARAVRANPLAASDPTLAELLRDAGYRTGAVVAGPWMMRVFGLDRGFDHYDDENIGSRAGRDGSEVSQRAIEFLDASTDAPFFLFLNYFDPHMPYTPPDEFRDLFVSEGEKADAVALYDAEIRYMDQQLGRVLDHLKATGKADDTLIVVTADHGELLGEHGRYRHGHTLFEEDIRVPLILKFPRGELLPTRSNAPVQLTDVMPIVLGRLGLPGPEGLGRHTTRPQIFAEVYPLKAASNAGHWRVLRVGPFKLHLNSDRHHLLYNLDEDPREEHNLAAEQKVRLRAMASRLKRFQRQLPKPEQAPTHDPRKVGPETRRALESLGYLPEDAP